MEPTDCCRRFGALSHWPRWLGWLAAHLALVAAVSWIAFHLQQEGFAPAVLFPLCVGATVGATSAGIAIAVRLPGARRAIVAAALWGLLVVVGQDYIGHRHRASHYRDQLGADPRLVLFTEEASRLQPSFADHLRGVINRSPTWWTLECLLTATGSALACTLTLALHARGSRRVVTSSLTPDP